jgi:hypothetical protein
MNNGFIKANTIGAGANGARTENGALSYATIGSALLDQFGKAGSFRGRPIMDVWADQQHLWAEDAENALKFPFYLRLITRQANIIGGEKTEKVQRGQGARDEAFKRLLWIAKYHPDEFYRNLWILPIVGSWKDLWVLMAFEGASEYINYKKFFQVIAEGINDPNHKDLVKKYLPRIRSEKKCTTDWAKRTNQLAKDFAKEAGWTFKDYRNFKSTGKAHVFQTIICKGLYSEINWNAIPGKALLNLVSGKFLSAHNLNEVYLDWLKSQPVAKFNGYAFELGRKLMNCGYNPSLATKITIDKQFDGLIETASKNDGAIKGNVLCALDTSASMTCYIDDTRTTTAYDVCVSLGIYFSELNKGAFHNTVAMFDDISRMMNLSGSFTDKYNQIRHASTAWGSTNFMSIIDLIVDTRRQNPSIPLDEFPKTLLVVSDWQFNPTGTYGSFTSSQESTNYQKAMEKLRSVFPDEFVDEFKIIWWYCSNSRTTDFPSTMEDGGTYMISGFDGSIISLLLGEQEVKANGETKKNPTMDELVEAALNQEVLTLVK